MFSAFRKHDVNLYYCKAFVPAVIDLRGFSTKLNLYCGYKELISTFCLIVMLNRVPRTCQQVATSLSILSSCRKPVDNKF